MLPKFASCFATPGISIIGSFYHPDSLFDHNFHLRAAVLGIKVLDGVDLTGWSGGGCCKL